MNVENYSVLEDRTKLHTVSMQTPSQLSHHSAASFPVHEVSSDSSASTSYSDWPSPFVFPTKNLPTYVQNALDKQINLCNPKQTPQRAVAANFVLRRCEVQNTPRSS